MPLYEYQCAKCGQHAERIEKLHGPFLQKCPKCGGKMERLLSAPAIQFKGSGWYVTDYAKSSAGGDKSAESSGDSGKTEKSGKSEGKGESKSAEKAPAKEKKKAAGKEK